MNDNYHNKRSPRKGKIEYIVIHDTGNEGIGANARAHVRYFQSTDRPASADYVVDDKEIILLNPNITGTCSWHCGDGSRPYSQRTITNHNSIGVEICRNKDGNWHQAKNNAIRLVMQLIREWTVPLNHVVRHYDASGKLCPSKMSANNWREWHEWKSALELMLEQDKARITYNGQQTEMECVLRNGHHYVPVRAIAQLLGCSVNWDNVNKTIIITPARS